MKVYRDETFGCRGPHDAQINCSEYFSLQPSVPDVTLRVNKPNWLQGWHCGKGLYLIGPIFQLVQLVFFRARVTMIEGVLRWLKVYEDEWRCMKMNEGVWRWMKMIEGVWKWCMKVNEDEWRLMKMNEDDWMCMKINEGVWWWMKVFDDNWRCMKMNEGVRRWMKMYESLCVIFGRLRHEKIKIKIKKNAAQNLTRCPSQPE